MTLLVAAVLLGLTAGFWVALPMVRRRLALMGDPLEGGVIDADARKRVALASLSEIEYDRIGGKLDQEDYTRLKAQLEREALLAIEAADAAKSASAVATAGVAGGSSDVGSFSVTHSCGFVNPPASRFCSGCGARL